MGGKSIKYHSHFFIHLYLIQFSCCLLCAIFSFFKFWVIKNGNLSVALMSSVKIIRLLVIYLIAIDAKSRLIY